MIILYSSLLLILAFLISVIVRNIKAKNIKEKQYKEFVSVFTNSKTLVPTLEYGSYYGWLSFTVTFANKKDCEYAEQKCLFEVFNRKIEAYYDAKFKSSMAINYEYLRED